MTRLHLTAEIIPPPHVARSTLADRVQREVLCPEDLSRAIADIVEVARVADAFEAGGCVSIVVQRGREAPRPGWNSNLSKGVK